MRFCTLLPMDISIGGIIGGIGKAIGEIGKDLGELPDLPLPRILPCPPAFPKIPLIPCHNVTQEPEHPVAECRPALAKYMAPFPHRRRAVAAEEVLRRRRSLLPG